MNVWYVRSRLVQTTVMPSSFPSRKPENNPWVSINLHALNICNIHSLPLVSSPSPPRWARQAGKRARLVPARERSAPPDGPFVSELGPVPLPEADALLQLRVGTLGHVARALGLDGAQLDLQVTEL